jgi:hypothetical protein
VSHQMPTDEPARPGDKNMIFWMCGLNHQFFLREMRPKLKDALPSPLTHFILIFIFIDGSSYSCQP